MSQNSKLGEFETYLQGKTDLSQAYADLPQVELPDHLDAAILAEAHRAVNSRPGTKPKRRWTIPLGMVASLFAVVMIGLQLPYLLKEAALPQQQEERMVAAMEKIMADSASPAADQSRNAQAMAQLMAKPKSTPAPLADEGKASATPIAPAPAAPQKSQITATQQLGAASVVASPSVDTPAQPPVKASKRLELRERADADSEVELSKENKISGHAEGNASGFLEQRAPAATSMTAPQPAQSARSLMQPPKEEAGETTLRPEDWLARIQLLKRQGKLDEARKSFAAFKKRYPDYRVPEALEVR